MILANNLIRYCSDNSVAPDFFPVVFIFPNVIQPGKEKIITQTILTPQPQKDASLFVTTGNNKIKIAGILVSLETWLEVKESKIASVSSYENGETSFVQIVLFEDIDINGIRKSYKKSTGL